MEDTPRSDDPSRPEEDAPARPVDAARLETLERRVKLLEAQLEEIRSTARRAAAALPGILPGQPQAHREPEAPRREEEAPQRGPWRAPGERPGARPAGRTRHRDPYRMPRPWEGTGLEEWLGRNALLAIGLLALVVAAGFTIKYAFDQGWVSPGLRVAAGLVAGAALALVGERVARRGARHFGAALVGGGAALAYLALWAAAGPYHMLGTVPGVGLLAVLAALVVWRAARLGEPALAALAAAGAYLAPPLLAQGERAGDALLLYLAAVALGTGGVAATRDWRLPFAVAVAGFVVLPLLGPPLAISPALLAIGFGAAAGLAAGTARARGWKALEVVSFLATWPWILWAATRATGGQAWLALLAPGLAAMPYLEARLRLPAGAEPRGPRSEADLWGFAAAAAGWFVAGGWAAESAPDALLFAVAAFYIAAGVTGLRWEALTAGALGLGWAARLPFDGMGTTAAWALLAAATMIVARPAALAPARWAAGILALAAGMRLFGSDLAVHAGPQLALTGSWSRVLYVLLLSVAAMAGPLWSRRGEIRTRQAGLSLRPLLWAGFVLLVLAGGTQEIHFAFRGGAYTLARLGEGLSISAWWLAVAAGLLALGFLRDSRVLRASGLAVGALALAKIVFWDLQQLEALFRVASFALLALVALAAAWAYHRRDGDPRSTPAAEAPGPPAEPPAEPEPPAAPSLEPPHDPE